MVAAQEVQGQTVKNGLLEGVNGLGVSPPGSWMRNGLVPQGLAGAPGQWWEAEPQVGAQAQVEGRLEAGWQAPGWPAGLELVSGPAPHRRVEEASGTPVPKGVAQAEGGLATG